MLLVAVLWRNGKHLGKAPSNESLSWIVNSSSNMLNLRPIIEQSAYQHALLCCKDLPISHQEAAKMFTRPHANSNSTPPMNYIFAFRFDTSLYMVFSNSEIIWPVCSSAGGKIWPPYNPQRPASRSMNYTTALANIISFKDQQ